MRGGAQPVKQNCSQLVKRLHDVVVCSCALGDVSWLHDDGNETAARCYMAWEGNQHPCSNMKSQTKRMEVHIGWIFSPLSM